MLGITRRRVCVGGIAIGTVVAQRLTCVTPRRMMRVCAGGRANVQYEIGLKQVPGNTRQYFSRHPEVWNLLNSQLFALSILALPPLCAPCVLLPSFTSFSSPFCLVALPLMLPLAGFPLGPCTSPAGCRFAVHLRPISVPCGVHICVFTIGSRARV